MKAFRILAETEGIIPAIESAHAISGALTLAATMDREQQVLVNLSGRGDKDVDTAARWFGLVTGEEVADAELAKDVAEGEGEGW
jgi:tryptophan synthase beta chain